MEIFQPLGVGLFFCLLGLVVFAAGFLPAFLRALDFLGVGFFLRAAITNSDSVAEPCCHFSEDGSSAWASHNLRKSRCSIVSEVGSGILKRAWPRHPLGDTPGGRGHNLCPTIRSSRDRFESVKLT